MHARAACPPPAGQCVPTVTTAPAPLAARVTPQMPRRPRVPRPASAAAWPQQPPHIAQAPRAACLVARAQQQTQTPTAALDDAYNAQMAKQMQWLSMASPYEYHFDRGLYFNEISPGLFCGTQPRSPAEIEQLAFGHGVTTIVNLQQDKDIEYWGIDFGANQHRCRELGISLLRHPARDFDPHSLRNTLPYATKAVAQALAAGGRVYVHCTAGLGRAPAVCIAWLYWYGPYLSLDAAYEHLTSIRPCGPKRDAIRGATFDILDDRHFDQFAHLPDDAWAHLNENDKALLQARLTYDWH